MTGVSAGLTILGIVEESSRNYFDALAEWILHFYISASPLPYPVYSQSCKSFIDLILIFQLSTSSIIMQRALSSRGRASLLPSVSPYSNTLLRSRPAAATALNIQQQRFAHKVCNTLPLAPTNPPSTTIECSTQRFLVALTRLLNH